MCLLRAHYIFSLVGTLLLYRVGKFFPKKAFPFLFYSTALKDCPGIVFSPMHPDGWVGGGWEKVCLGSILETIRCRKMKLGRDIGGGGGGGGCATLWCNFDLTLP